MKPSARRKERWRTTDTLLVAFLTSVVVLGATAKALNDKEPKTIMLVRN